MYVITEVITVFQKPHTHACQNTHESTYHVLEGQDRVAGFEYVRVQQHLQRHCAAGGRPAGPPFDGRRRLRGDAVHVVVVVVAAAVIDHLRKTPTGRRAAAGRVERWTPGDRIGSGRTNRRSGAVRYAAVASRIIREKIQI